MGEMGREFDFWLGCQKSRDYLENLGVIGRILLIWTEFIWLRIETDGGPCEYGNEHLFCVKSRECLDHLSLLLAFQEEICSVLLV
jgi:hypothetical protein